MSDSIEELSRQYMENVWENHARSIGLFPIPEYPEFEAERGMWSTALDVLLTTLRYIAPATILTLFWGQQSFLFKLLKYIDSAVRSLVFSNEEQKQNVLQWLGEAGPVRVDKLEVVWRHGWIVCGVLDAALPGACAGHPPTRLSLKHAQSIADNYLGVDPAFSRQELESNDSLSRHQEWKLINYLENIRLSMLKLTTPTPKSTNSPVQKQTEEVSHFTLDYIARGSGLVAAQLNHKVYFKIYPTAQQSLDPGEINILIHGPKDTYGISVLAPILGKAQLIRQSLLGLQSKPSYTENVLPITQGTTYLRSYGSNDINKTFYIPKTKYDIDIDIEIKQDHAKVGYVASLEGKYEVSITSRGQNVVGSPFKVKASNDILGNLVGDSFCLEDGEEIDIVDVKTDRKVVLRIVDFVTEKMLLNENGTFEKISDEEARYLMQTGNVNVPNTNTAHLKRKNTEVKGKSKSSRFYHIAKKVLILCRICKAFQKRQYKKVLFKSNVKYNKDSRDKQNIPDILNSTTYDGQLKSHTLLKNRNRIIVPENISVALLTEMPKTFIEEKKLIDTSDMNMHSYKDSSESYNVLKVDRFEDDTMSVDTVQSSINPFVNDIYDQSHPVRKGLRSLIPKEFETHNLQHEETQNQTADLYINSQSEMNKLNINPFIDGTLERPKTPVYKIISGEVTNRNDSVYINQEQALLTDESACNSLTNPFLKQETEITSIYQERPDFIIGAPVSLPPVNYIPSTKTNIDRITSTEKKNKTSDGNTTTAIHCGTEFSTRDSDVAIKDQMDGNFSSLDSNLTQDIIIISRGSPTPTTPNQSQTSREMSPKKDTWDSAYVSIDDTNCFSENNVNELINESFNKRKSPLSEDLSKMGPAEREIWQCDSELKDIAYNDEDNRLYKHDLRRPEFTPIIEENEKIITSDMKDSNGYNTDSDLVGATFSELSDIYDDYTNSENISATTTQDHRLQNLGVDYTLLGNDIHVDSASDILTDVKRHAKKFEGKISEVQATESFSVSPSLHVKSNELYQEQNNNDEIQFGDRIYSNIVSEKKKYWDDKIKQIEEKSEEIRLFQNKRRLTSKYLRRNDSITKRKGKKIVHHILNSGPEDYETYTKANTESSNFLKTQDYNVENMKNLKIFEDKGIESNKCSFKNCFGKKPAGIKKASTIDRLSEGKESSSKFPNIDIPDAIKQASNSNVELKQEVSEKVFQAFETSPKRFFGTSRKHILNKIETFLGSNDDEKESGKDTSDVNYESGLVSSRISLFHNISQTEELPCSQRKSKSMHNISYQSAEINLSLDRINGDSKEVVDENNKGSKENLSCSNQPQDSPTSLKEKRARLIQSANNKSFDDTVCFKHSNTDSEYNYVKKTIKDFSSQNDSQFQSSTSKLKSISKSEMDIFNKKTTTIINEDLDKHKSYDELPKVSVKNFISLYEDVSKTSNNKTSPIKIIHNVNYAGSSNNQVPISTQGTTSTINISTTATPVIKSSSTTTSQLGNPDSLAKTLSQDSLRISNDKSNNLISSFNNKAISTKDKEKKFLNLSDIDIEIIDNDQERSDSPKGETAHLDYKNRFSKAKQFFQSLEELREEKRLKNHGLYNFEKNNSIESLDDKKRRKKSKIKKSHSMPSSEIAKAWNQLHDQKEERKLVKISEKFNVDDLFEDVMEGRLSRQGSLRGIPHKKAVLETFKSMENLTDSNLNSYEMAESQLNDFAKDNKIRNAQTYLTEYPYLPTTDPSKYHSRLDVNASGLITFKELKKIPRRNSVPDLRLNPNSTFTADL